jgi:hypothetical protein
VKNKITETKIDELIPDNLNANKGTEYGQHLVEQSLRKFGAARAIVLDKKNRIICGNKTIENAATIGLENVILVETDGKQIVAVKRTDIDLDSAQGRELAVADNASAKANINWDHEVLASIEEQWDVKPEDWGIELTEGLDLPKEDEKKEISTRLIVECQDVVRLSSLFTELQDRGFVCELKE